MESSAKVEEEMQRRRSAYENTKALEQLQHQSRLVIRDFSWKKESFSSMSASFTIINGEDFDVKDVEITCRHKAPSGTIIDKKETGRTKTSFAREAIIEHLEDLEDIHLATQRLELAGKTHSIEDVKHELGL